MNEQKLRKTIAKLLWALGNDQNEVYGLLQTLIAEVYGEFSAEQQATIMHFISARFLKWEQCEDKTKQN